MAAKIVRHASERHYTDPAAAEGDNALRPFPSLADRPSLYATVVVPAMNEEKRLPAMLDECLEYLQGRASADAGFTWEVIVVDDGSSDGTAALALDYCRRVGADRLRLLKLEHNRGKGGAVRLGALCARGRLVMFADADGATRFADFELLERPLRRLCDGDGGGGDGDGRAGVPADDDAKCLSIGSRAHLEQRSMAERSLFRTVLMRGFHMLVWLFAVAGIKDTQCGFKMFTRPAARFLFGNLHVERWAFDVELLRLAQRTRMPIAEVCVNWHEVDGSKLVPVLSWLQMGADLLGIWLRYAIGAWRYVHEPDLRV